MIINEYKERLLNNRGYSKNTVKNYARTLELFNGYLKEYRKSIEDTKRIKLGVIENFIAKQREYKDVRTCNNYLASIRLFLRFCLVKWYKTEDYNKVLFAREPKKKIEALQNGDMEKMINYLKNQRPTTKYWDLIRVRNLVILQLLFYTGLRVSELINIKVEEVGEEMQILGKGNKVRTINLYEDDLKLIQLYLFMRRKFDCEYLFISFSGNAMNKKLSAVSVEAYIRDIAKGAGITYRVFPHKIRHTFATNLLRCNAPLPHIQELLGHNSILTTQHYLTVLNSELRDTQENLHKKFRIKI